MLSKFALYPVANRVASYRELFLQMIFSLACTSVPGFILQMHVFLLSVGSKSLDPDTVWLLESGHCNTIPTCKFLPLARLTSKTFLTAIPLLLFSHVKEIAQSCHYRLNIHCPDLQSMFFNCSIHFCEAISHHYFLSHLI